MRIAAERGVTCAVAMNRRHIPLLQEVLKKLSAVTTITEIDDVYRPFRPKRKTRAGVAREKGLAPLAEQFFLSRYYLMHLFRAETGYTLLGYITEKRLLLARQLMRNGRSVTEACYEAGFTNYSSFLRSFKKHYGVLPSAVNPME